jgi:DNA-binding XRE family transcriptional regulator
MPSNELIIAVGPILFGRNWQSELADTLGINRRTIRRWLTGEYEPRPGVWVELLEIVRERHQQLGSLIEEVEKHARATGEPR